MVARCWHSTGGLPTFDRELKAEDLDPPAPTPRRLFDLGAAVARIMSASPWRVALLASSGWSHAFLTEKTHFLYPDTPADRRLMTRYEPATRFLARLSGGGDRRIRANRKR